MKQYQGSSYKPQNWKIPLAHHIKYYVNCLFLSEKSSESESKLLEPGKLPECYNGAVLDKYTWSQTIKDIDIKVPVPKCVQRARDLSVEIKSTSLKVSLKGNIPLEGMFNRGGSILGERCRGCAPPWVNFVHLFEDKQYKIMCFFALIQRVAP